MGRSDESGRALKHAVEIDGGSVSAHDALALWYESVGQMNAALLEYRRSLNLDADDTGAKIAIMRLENQK
jgi:Tfp pilus assembly protein PilF